MVRFIFISWKRLMAVALQNDAGTQYVTDAERILWQVNRCTFLNRSVLSAQSGKFFCLNKLKMYPSHIQLISGNYPFYEPEPLWIITFNE
jgi:hypothetical protein